MFPSLLKFWLLFENKNPLGVSQPTILIFWYLDICICCMLINPYDFFFLKTSLNWINFGSLSPGLCKYLSRFNSDGWMGPTRCMTCREGKRLLHRETEWRGLMNLAGISAELFLRRRQWVRLKSEQAILFIESRLYMQRLSKERKNWKRERSPPHYTLVSPDFPAPYRISRGGKKKHSDSCRNIERPLWLCRAF